MTIIQLGVRGAGAYKLRARGIGHAQLAISARVVVSRNATQEGSPQADP
jgi:hypothetical protein